MDCCRPHISYCNNACEKLYGNWASIVRHFKMCDSVPAMPQTILHRHRYEMCDIHYQVCTQQACRIEGREHIPNPSEQERPPLLHDTSKGVMYPCHTPWFWTWNVSDKITRSLSKVFYWISMFYRRKKIGFLSFFFFPDSYKRKKTTFLIV